MRSSRPYGIIIILFALLSCNESGDSANSVGQGGSLTRFAINNTFLYIATNARIAVYDISENNFTHIKDVQVGFGLETIFVKSPYLYLGSSEAMYIYSIANPASPEFIFRYAHIVACDPVVVQGNRAYVTLRSTGNLCNRGVNSLEIINISNPYNPQLILNYPMTAPGGLAIDGDCLFICEGNNGLKMFSVANDEVSLLNSITNVNAYDVIAKNNRLTLTGEDGVFQYAYNCSTSALSLISKIPVQRADL